MTIRELSALLDRTGSIPLDGLTVRVTICDIKMAYGSASVYVTPVAGAGYRWVALDRVTLDKVPTKGAYL